MADEQIKETPAADEQVATKEQRKANAIKKIIEVATTVMKAAFSKGDANTVWYKKGLYYIAAGILAVVVYAFTYHGVEIIDWVTTLVTSMF